MIISTPSALWMCIHTRESIQNGYSSLGIKNKGTHSLHQLLWIWTRRPCAQSAVVLPSHWQGSSSLWLLCTCPSLLLYHVQWANTQWTSLFPPQTHISLGSTLNYTWLLCWTTLPNQQRVDPLPLLHTKKIEGGRWSGLVNNELFFEQLRKLVKGGDVAIRKATKQMQSCARERTHEHLAMYGVYSSRNDHLSIEHRKMALGVFYSRENNLGRYVFSRYESIHNRLR